MKILNYSAKTDSVLSGLQYIVLGSALLYFGRTLLIPLSFAALISFVLYPVCKWMERKGISKMAAILMSIGLVILLFAAALTLLFHQFSLFLKEWPVIHTKLDEALTNFSHYLSSTLALSKAQQEELLSQIGNSSSTTLFTIFKEFLSASASNLVLLIVIPVFAALILFYRKILVDALFLLFPKQSKIRIRKLLFLTINSYYSFIKGMIIVYAIVGTLNSIGLLLLGVPHAIFFGFVAAILTFIPYIGIIVGSLLPMAMAWITYNSIWYSLGVVLIFTFVQYLEANVIFPLTVSNRLNVNALATLIAILLGGILWGVSGMILFVPFLGILKLIADRNSNLRVISVLIGTQKSLPTGVVPKASDK